MREQIPIQIAEDQRVSQYAQIVNVAALTHEVTITFLQVLPPTPTGSMPEHLDTVLVARVSVPFKVAGDLAGMLSQAVENRNAADPTDDRSR